MATDEINKYIEKRYDRWLDYARYHCSCVGIADEANDVLNEVLCSLLQKSPAKLNRLLSRKDERYTELDYYVLRMIKLNATSDTSPYRHKYRSVSLDKNIDYSEIEIEDIAEEQDDAPGEILEKVHQIRQALDEIFISDYSRKVFEFRFFHGELFSSWDGPESEKELFEMYYRVESLLKRKINGEMMF